jgi:hypothetical protein
MLAAMPRPQNEREQWKEERAEIPAQIAALQRDLDATPGLLICAPIIYFSASNPAKVPPRVKSHCPVRVPALEVQQ